MYITNPLIYRTERTKPVKSAVNPAVLPVTEVKPDEGYEHKEETLREGEKEAEAYRKLGEAFIARKKAKEAAADLLPGA